MAVFNDKLYVTDVNKVYSFDIKTKNLAQKIVLEDSEFLNDIAIDANGDIFVSDTQQRKIYKVDGKTLKSEVFIEGIKKEGEAKTHAPNGLYIKHNKLYVASWSKGSKPGWEYDGIGSFFTVDLNDKSVHFIAEDLGHLDGIEPLSCKKWLVSAKSENKMFLIGENGTVKEILADVTDIADFDFCPKSKLLVLPLMDSGQIRFYQL
ncbi:MAG: hypothetical protein ABIA04_09010 [Pseudomonadota bacterium]